MIIKASSGNGFSGTLLYVYKDGKDLQENQKPIIIEKNNVWGSPKNMARQMREQSENSSHLQKPVLHLSVAFSPEDKLTQAKEIECIKSTMQHFGISEEKNQYVLVKHNDTNNNHYHIVVNRLNYDNKSLNIDWVKNDCNGIADRVEQEHNLHRVQGRNRIFDIEKGEYRSATKEERAKNTQAKQTKVFRDKSPKLNEYQTKIQSGVSEVLANKTVISKEQFQNELAKKNIQAKINTDETNKIKGISYRYDKKLSVKGSEVGYSANIVSTKLEENKAIAEAKEIPKIKIEDQQKNAGPKFQEVPKVEAKPEEKLSAAPGAKSAPGTPPKNEEIKPEAKPKTTLTMEEKNLRNHTIAYNKATDKVIDEHNTEFKKGNSKPDTDDICKRNDFVKVEKNEYNFTNNNNTSTLNTTEIEKNKGQVAVEFHVHSIEVEKQKATDTKTLEEKPKTSIFGLSAQSKEYNKDLAKRQEKAKANKMFPQRQKQFNPTLIERDKYSKQLPPELKAKETKIIKEITEEKAEALKQEREKNKNQNKGLGR